MEDEDKTRGQLINELTEPCQRLAELEALETERKQAEEALRESEEKYRSLFELAPDSITTLDMRGVITSCNPAVLKLSGYSEDELVGKHFSKLPFFRVRDIPKHVKAFGFVLMGKVPKPFEAIYYRKDGTPRWVEARLSLLEAGGKKVGVQAITRDITERKRVETALRESEEHHRALVEASGLMGEAVVLLQNTEKVEAAHLFANQEWARITGYTAEELREISYLDLIHPRHGDAVTERVRRRFHGKDVPGRYEISIITKDGTEVPVEAAGTLITYRDKPAIVGYIRDITERKRAEEREKQLQQELNLSSRLASIGELAAGVAHEINNPLTGILVLSQRRLRKSTDGKARQDLEGIHNEARRAARVVENLLTFARRREPKREYLDINDILKKALELRGYELKTSNIEVVTDLASSLPKTKVDFHQIQEVFLNIIMNAGQAMTEADHGGKISIKTQQMKDYIRVSFTDDGPGIPAENLDKIFDPFFTTRGKRSGTGLGLSVCHGIVTEHGGRIYVKSQLGKGATFFVELPLTSEKVKEAKRS